MPKVRVGQQIKEALHGKKAASNKSADIDFLTERFKQLKVKIRHLIEALRAQHLSLLRMNETRLLVAKRVAALANEGPVASLAGTVPDEELQANSDDMTSYMAIHQNVHVRHRLYCDRFLDHVVEYAVEWERVVVSRVSHSLNRADKLRLDLDHYQTKVDTIRSEKTRRIAKGGMIDSKMAEKLYRNEAKLSHSRQKYETYASDLSQLIEEVTARGWKDLHPILLKVSQFDATLAFDEHQLLSNLNQVASSLKQIATRYHLTPESRLKDLEGLTSKVLNAPSASDENLIEDEPKKDKEYYMESMNSRRLLESTSSSKENNDVVHGVMTSLKVVAPGTSPPSSGTLLSQIGAVANAAPPPHAKTPTRRSSPRNRGGFSGKPKEMNIPSHSHSSSNSRMIQKSPRGSNNSRMAQESPRSSSRNRERASSRAPQEMNIPSHSDSSSNSRIAQKSPRSSSRNRERASSRTPRARRAPDTKSTVNPFDGLVEERRLNSSSGSAHNNYPPSPRGSSSREGRERSRYSDSSPRAAGHIPKSPRTPSRTMTPSDNQAQYPEEHNPHHGAPSPKNNFNSMVQHQNQHSTGQYQNYQDSGQYQSDAPNSQGFDGYGQQQQHQHYQQNTNPSGYEQRGRHESSQRHMNMNMPQEQNYQYPPTLPIATARQGSGETSSKPWYQTLF
eukprot:CAMPEP_0194075512 /NCGR_PEP_ID=MMETSP0149-20130528/2507_1 /TAXON_ID=122233 /ORGANISM="Chaetoceros debilis, Strain MM31A-1" /LENGTH=673 /DNA_ID=CAMNT_0038756017 /DNA_START=37 /DNA_END=2058 /DNA_ORIENTATION=+